MACRNATHGLEEATQNFGMQGPIREVAVEIVVEGFALESIPEKNESRFSRR